LLTHLTDTLTVLITNLYVTTGLVGILLAMAIESCCIPLPSEIVMPLAGVMIASGKLLHGTSFGVSLILVALAGSFGCLLGSTVAYAIGYSGGRPLLLQYGRYVLISQHDADRADYFFQRWGSATVFFSRLLPVVRTYISLPAGITKMPFGKFVVYTFLGSLPWCLVLTYVGYQLGNHLSTLASVFHGLDVVIVLVVVVLVVLYVWRHIRNDRKARAAHAAAGSVGNPTQAQMSSADAWNQAQQWSQQTQSGWGQSQGQAGWGQSQPQGSAQQAPWQAQPGWGQPAPQSPQPFQQPQWGQQPPQTGWDQSQQPPQSPQQGWGQAPAPQQPVQPFQTQPGWGQPTPVPPQQPAQSGWGQPQFQPGQPWFPQSGNSDQTVRRN